MQMEMYLIGKYITLLEIAADVDLLSIKRTLSW